MPNQINLSDQGCTRVEFVQIPTSCPAQQPCPECPAVQPSFLISWLLGYTLYWLTIGRWQYKKAFDKAVQRRLDELLSTPQKTSESDLFKQLETKLINLMHGDQAAAIRLVQSIKSKYPSQSAKWCYEKAIEDLERDRR